MVTFNNNTTAVTKRSITVLGSTGSIGRNTLDLLRSPELDFDVIALTGNQNVKLLIQQAKEFSPKFVAIGEVQQYNELKAGLAGTGIESAAGAPALIEAATMNSEIVVAGIVGIAGLFPTMAAAERGSIIALANKECLVCSGPIFLSQIEENGATLIPVDSEHNAIFQVLNYNQIESVERLTLTASGGPFAKYSVEDMMLVTPSEATKHPNWQMGNKISVDSATMMNKGLELIEAFYLFPVKEEQIDILIHPQSVIHSMVSYTDGSVLAQMGTPDMRIPISFALGWPDRLYTTTDRLDLSRIADLTFHNPDFDRFPALGLAREALKSGRAMPTILNAANEVAVHHFLGGKIGFLDIIKVIDEVLQRVPNIDLKKLDDIQDCDQETRKISEAVAALYVK